MKFQAPSTKLQRNSKFQTSNFKFQIPHTGLDEIEFQFAPNPGEPAKPLRAIASSGEMARVMLALKTVLAAEDEIPVLIFDEVDANVGGETANAVGEKMKQIAAKRQVLCITHLPQVAAPADAHIPCTLSSNKIATASRRWNPILLVFGRRRSARPFTRVSEIPFISRQLTVWMHIPFASDKRQLPLREIGIY